MRFFWIFSLAATSFWGLPEIPQLARGDAQFLASPQLLEATVSDQTILEWARFSIGQGETVRFLQPSAQSVLLNRVIGADISEIFGTLQANGAVYLINPRGVIIGENALIDTAAFLVSAFDIADSDFLEGKNLAFRGESEASVVQLLHCRQAQ